LEGVGQYILKKNLLKTGFGGVYDDGSNLVAAQWAMDNEVSDGALTPSNTLPCTVAVITCILYLPDGCCMPIAVRVISCATVSYESVVSIVWFAAV
jgi:hypothetical protein